MFIKDLRFNSNFEFENFRNQLILLSGGSYSSCYRLNHMFLKVIEDIEIKPKNDLLKFSNIKVDGYVFITNLIQVIDQIKGVITVFIDGIQLSRYPIDKIKYTELLIAFKQVEMATKQISDYGIKVNDVDISNILYCPKTLSTTNNIFNFVDTIDYEFVDIDPNQLYKINMQYIMINIFECLLEKIDNKIIVSIKEFKNYQENIDLLSNPVYFLTILRERLSIYCNKKTLTVSGAVKILQTKNYKFWN